ncbi:EAL and HDOD domain-containing protein [Dyella acidiphila]|uniref:HDOD domain-containing protein n=1 Tax=Dyella acidiphila TaxID=2775866 RepID=A0ABR9G6B4_9GAMM|nr:HDOD domain-containing protein [Dyella acidiphila]MBE1159553.1 HDOD domain-containing protein [Dyella acidiphila]
MTTSTASATAPATPGNDAPNSLSDLLLPVVRSPILDQEEELFAYELVFYRQGAGTDADTTMIGGILSGITDGAITRLVRGNRAFMRMPRSLLLEQTDVLAHTPRLGVIVDPFQVRDAAVVQRLQQLALRNCPLMLDLGSLDPAASQPHGALEPLLRLARYVRINAKALDPDTLAIRCKQLFQRGLGVIAGNVDDHVTYGHCKDLPFQAIQGRYLLVPQQIEVPVLTPNRLSLLRLMSALQENNAGPVELGEIIRDDAVLSYKLLGCVNSAYFALPRQLKSIQQAAIFFGVARMRNWINTMSLSSMDDRPPELLRAALIRAHMCEKLAQGMSTEQQDMAFMAGLLSLLDTLLCAPMEFVLSHLPLAPEIREALVEERGPFAPLLGQIYAWETGDLQTAQIQPQNIRKMAGAYYAATQWADQVYSFAEQRPN